MNVVAVALLRFKWFRFGDSQALVEEDCVTRRQFVQENISFLRQNEFEHNFEKI